MPAGVSATAIALGASHTCAIEAGGGVKCWGLNDYGQLGIGSTLQQASPVAVAGAGGWGDRDVSGHYIFMYIIYIICILYMYIYVWAWKPPTLSDFDERRVAPARQARSALLAQVRPRLQRTLTPPPRGKVGGNSAAAQPPHTLTTSTAGRLDALGGGVMLCRQAGAGGEWDCVAGIRVAVCGIRPGSVLPC